MIIFAVLAVVSFEPPAAVPSDASPISPPSAAGSAPTPPPVIMSPDGFRVGIDTFQTVTAKLGKPKSVTASSTGMTIAVYIHTKTGIKATTFIPYVGLFAGGAKSKFSYKTFTFDATGTLQSFTSSDDTTDCNTTFFSASCH